MPTVLVTGGAGYIGSHMVRQLRQAGYRAVVVDDLRGGHRRAVEDAELHVGDIGDAGFVGGVLATVKPDAVMHFAGLIQVGESVRDPAAYYRNNVTATQVLLDAMRAHAVTRLIFSSSAAVYGTPVRVPLDETHQRRPLSPYGRSKWFVEQMLEDYAAAYALCFIGLRYFNAAGADPAGGLGECHAPETHLIPLALQAAAGRLPYLTVHGDDHDTPDGTCIRDYVHVQDLCGAHLLALQRLLQGGTGGHYNIGSGSGFSVREVIDTVQRVTGRPIRTVIGARRAGDPARLVADARNARDALGWRPQYSGLDAIVAHAWAWERSHFGKD